MTSGAASPALETFSARVSVKAGSTVPLKLEAFLPNGTEITTTETLSAHVTLR